MRETRKALEAQNIKLRAQLAVHNNVTRQSLNNYVRETSAKNKTLEAQVKKLTEKVAELTAAQEAQPA